MNRLGGKVAIVTGADQGMGEAHARLVVAEGARVVLTDINSRDGERVARGLGDAAVFAPHQVAHADDRGRVVALANERFGPVSVLVNNAGIPVNSVHPGYILTPMDGRRDRRKRRRSRRSYSLGKTGPARRSVAGGAVPRFG